MHPNAISHHAARHNAANSVHTAALLRERHRIDGADRCGTYNEDNTLSLVKNLLANGTVMTQHDYTYDSYGNRTRHIQNVSSNVLDYSYGYDELSRLVSVVGGISGNESYTYDPLNNLKSRTARGGPAQLDRNSGLLSVALRVRPPELLAAK